MDYYKRALELNDETVKTDVTSTRMQNGTSYANGLCICDGQIDQIWLNTFPMW